MSDPKDKRGQAWRIHETARFLVGKYAGLVGTVTGTDTEAGLVRVVGEGVKDGEPVSFDVWIKGGALGRNDA